MYKNKKNGIWGRIITIIILVILVFTSNISINNFSSIENVLNKLVMPFQNIYIAIKNKLLNDDNYVKTTENLKQQIEALTKQNKELQAQIEELQIVKSENTILREYAGLGEQYSDYDFVSAYIINKDISNLSSIFVINVGTNNGVYENMPVMSKDGLVGHTISATKNTAKVEPIIDSASRISAQTSNSRENVLVKGEIDSNNNLKVDCLQSNTQMIEGEEIVTSGLGGIYPKGIKIGTIKEVFETKNVIEKYAILEPTVNFKKLEYVVVIKNNGF